MPPPCARNPVTGSLSSRPRPRGLRRLTGHCSASAAASENQARGCHVRGPGRDVIRRRGLGAVRDGGVGPDSAPLLVRGRTWAERLRSPGGRERWEPWEPMRLE
ncbi:unnamed protein product [Rangifer tarandus platyrhynchus]|uniref:Uncharacterized protein n=2 Tax=Rangifer tarandus platyrhynchus TaxID=3082113 RepID=A0ABN9A3E1_RANTA|nr:unnamed protein product [Rangifer tarandus platyrhynchus]CAI9713958.1 unnamed protein product [Rangifer tarandus platyrhynchus]